MTTPRKPAAKRTSAKLPSAADAYAIRSMGYHEWCCATDMERRELSRAFRAGAAWQRRQKGRP
jgi:hypothetical protein